MEIPTVKIELYERSKLEFTWQIKQALENVGCLQIDGLEQELVDKLYDYAQKSGKKLTSENTYLGKSFYRYTLGLPPSENLSGSCEDEPEPERHFIDELMRKIKINVGDIVKAIYDEDDSSYLKIKYPDPILMGYYKDLEWFLHLTKIK